MRTLDTTYSSPLVDARTYEQKARQQRSEGRIQDAYEAFLNAGNLYSTAGEHAAASVCFAQAASCWNIYAGEQPLRNAATANESAAHEALKSSNFEYAYQLFREAALLYDREENAEKYSLCYQMAHEASRYHHAACFRDARLGDNKILHLRKWFLISLGKWVWGYGERPFRTFAVSLVVIVAAALYYCTLGDFNYLGSPTKLNVIRAVYFSVSSFTTHGYGDYLPLGASRLIASLQSISGIILSPLFIIALSRRYLRM